MARLVQSQLIGATTAFFQKDVGPAEKVVERDPQVDDRLALLEEKSFQRIAAESPDSARRSLAPRIGAEPDG